MANYANPLRQNVMDLGPISRQILARGAAQVAPVVLPVVETFPTGWLVSNGNSVANATISGAVQIQWPCDGYLVEIRATVRDGTAASQAGNLLRVVVDGNTELFTTGSAAGYLSFSMISGSGVGQQALKTRVSFRQGTAWQIYINNTTATNPVVSDIAFGYINTSQPRT